MNQDQFNELTKKLLTACKDALGMKAGEYAREGDRLHNFYAAARKRNKHPLDSLLAMQVKHRVSIDDICDDIINHKKFPTDEMMLEKFKDDINYNLLAFALIYELREKARKEVFAVRPRRELVKIDLETFHTEFLVKPTQELPSGTISRADAEKNICKGVMWEGSLYLPVVEKEPWECTGCFFTKYAAHCRCFCKDRSKTSAECCNGIIWLKVV